MKFFSTIVFVALLSAGNCFSQEASSPVFSLNKLPPEGVLLDKGWKFQRAPLQGTGAAHGDEIKVDTTEHGETILQHPYSAQHN